MDNGGRSLAPQMMGEVAMLASAQPASARTRAAAAFRRATQLPENAITRGLHRGGHCFRLHTDAGLSLRAKQPRTAKLSHGVLAIARALVRL
jgi:hypothetical protein